MLIVAMVHSRLDYGNAVLAGLPAYLLRRLQSVLNASSRLMYRLGFRDHITDALISLHLATCSRTHRVQAGHVDVKTPAQSSTKLPWASRPCCRCAWSSATPLCQHQLPDGAACQAVHVHLSATELSRLLHLACGTGCLTKLHLLSHCIHSGDIWKHSCFSDLFRTSSWHSSGPSNSFFLLSHYKNLRLD